MISRNETIPEGLTDQALRNIVNNGPAGGMYRALTLLGVRPEYRQGVEIRIYELRFRTVYHQSGLSDKIPTGISESYAYRQALRELADQLAEQGESR
jgi:hypothetical protein